MNQKRSKKSSMLALLLIMAMFIFFIQIPATYASNGIIPDDRMMNWTPGVNAGVPGGIPDRTTIFVNVATTDNPSYKCYGDGVTDNYQALQNAMNDCPAGQVIYIPAGTYRLSTYPRAATRSNYTIRGDGQGKTILLSYATTGYGALAFGASDWPRPTTGFDITGGATKGSTTVTVTDTSSVNVGKLVRIDPANPTWVHNLNGANNNPTMSFMFKVVSKTATSVTFTPALPIDLSSYTPKLVPYSTLMIEGVGIEGLTVDLNNSTGAAIYMEQAWGCWIKDVEITNSNTRQMFLVALSASEIRECFTHNCKSGGPNHEGIDFYTDSCWNLVEDNIVYNGGFPGIIVGDSKGGCQGNVIAYNYCGGVNSGSNIAGGDISFSHGPHNMLNLVEGNVLGMIQADGYFGSSSHNTVFRNWIKAEPPQSGTTNILRAVSLGHYNDYYNVVGNVLGTPDFPSDPNGVYTTETPSYNGSTRVIYQLGYPNMGNTSYSGTIGPSTPPDYTNEPFTLSAAQGLDLNVKTTLMRWGNYDYATKTTRWESSEVPGDVPVPSDHNLPASLYLDAKPAWWGSLAWPAIGPDLTEMTGKIPAQVRFESIPQPPPPPEPTPVPGIVGYNGDSDGADYLSGASWGDTICVSRYQAPSAMTVSDIYAKLISTTGKFRFAIYSDNGGDVGSLMAQTGEVVNPSADGWYSASLTQPQNLTEGSWYWLAAWSNAGSLGNNAKIACNISGGNVKWTDNITYGNYPNTLPITGGAEYKYCIYAAPEKVLGYNGDNEGTDDISDKSWGDTINANRYQAPASMTVNDIYAKLKSTVGSFRYAIYSDNGGKVGNLMAQTGEVVNPSSDGWYGASLTQPQNLTEGAWYWLAVWSNAGSLGHGAKIGCNYSDGNVNWTGNIAYGNYPDTLPITGGGNYKYCIYAAKDKAAPVVEKHADIGPVEATGPSGAAVTFTSPAATDLVDGTVTVTTDKASGSTFPLGTTTVTCSATDKAGNTGTSTFTVTVVDTTAPVVAKLADIGPVEATGPSGAVVTFTAPAATDLVDGSVPVTTDIASGSTFPLGTTTVTCSAIDKAGNKGTSTFTVTVVDKTAPIVAKTANIGPVEATGPSGAVVTFTAPAATDLVDGTVTVTTDKASGSTFPLGTTTVTCSAADKAGNKGTSTFTVTVVDKTAPVLKLPANITVYATKASGANVAFTVSAVDTVDGNCKVTCTQKSGSTFDLGLTTVNCTVVDKHGNIAKGSFTITVKYNFSGFFHPIDMGGAVNNVTAGSLIQIRFSLHGNMGLNIFDRKGPASIQVMTFSDKLPANAKETVIHYYDLSYDCRSGQYTILWKTDKDWAGTCRQLVVRFKDGTMAPLANFKFKKIR